MKERLTNIMLGFLLMVLVVVFYSLLGCSPMHEARLFLQSEAGQKVIDRMDFRGEMNIRNPDVELYVKTAIGMRVVGAEYLAEVTAGGEVSDDERAFAPGLVEPRTPRKDE